MHWSHPESKEVRSPDAPSTKFVFPRPPSPNGYGRDLNLQVLSGSHAGSTASYHNLTMSHSRGRTLNPSTGISTTPSVPSPSP